MSAHLTATMLRLLRGQDIEPSEPGALSDMAESHLAILEERIAIAFCRERAEVPLADGVVFSRERAEKKLAEKEAKRAYPPLRTALQNALDRCGDPCDFDLGHDVAAEDHALLARLGEGIEVALDVLGHPENAAAFDRALDLPDERGLYSHQAARELASGIQLDGGPLFRVRVPRALAGHVVQDTRGVRAFYAPTLRAAGFRNLVEGFGTARILAAVEHPLSSALMGTALHFAYHSAVVRKAVLGDDRGRDVEREHRAAEVIRAYIAAARVHGICEEASEHLRVRIEPWLPAPWPGIGPLVCARAAMLGRAKRADLGARLHHALVERFDEAYALTGGAFSLLRGAKEALVREELTVLELYDAPPFDLVDELFRHV